MHQAILIYDFASTFENSGIHCHRDDDESHYNRDRDYNTDKVTQQADAVD